LSSAAIQKKGLTSAQQSNLFWLNVLMGTFLTIVVASAAPLIASFYDKPELVKVTLVLSLSFIITSFGTQHGAMLVRRMQFARYSGAKIAGAVATLIISVVLALKGYSYWSLVWGTVAGTVVTTALILVLSPFRPGLPSRGCGMRELVGFGANVTAFNFVNYFGRNLDNILIGRFVGADALGLYSRAYQLLLFPITNLRAPILSVAFPAMSRLDSKSEDFRRYYCRIVELLAWVTMPLMGWMYVASDEIINIVLGPNWAAVGPIFSILAIVGFIQPIASLRGLILLSSGQARRNLYAGLIGAATVSLGFVIGVYWGVLGVAWSYACSIWVFLIPMQFYCSKGTSVRGLDIARAAKIPFLLSIVQIILCQIMKQNMCGVPEAIVVGSLALLVLTMTIVFYILFPENRKFILQSFTSLRLN
ncbi:MAG: lipopolysaccharide biosynthesis protein, partial [Gammaproteobacteria bacterium]|nr:lipopolysaccharide biosynthesis protein [Gammaproteobacteria bacterium]